MSKHWWEANSRLASLVRRGGAAGGVLALLLVLARPALAHDNLGGDELAMAFWMFAFSVAIAATGAFALYIAAAHRPVQPTSKRPSTACWRMRPTWTTWPRRNRRSRQRLPLARRRREPPRQRPCRAPFLTRNSVSAVRSTFHVSRTGGRLCSPMIRPFYSPGNTISPRKSMSSARCSLSCWRSSLLSRMGRDRRNLPNELGRNVEDFAGLIQEANGPLPWFLVGFYIIIATRDHRLCGRDPGQRLSLLAARRAAGPVTEVLDYDRSDAAPASGY